MNKLIAVLGFSSFMLLSVFFSSHSPKNEEVVYHYSEVIELENNDFLSADCCGTITINTPICNTKRVTFNFALQPTSGGTIISLGTGSNYVALDKNTSYTLTFTYTGPAPGPTCFATTASYDLCGATGSLTLNPSDSFVTGTADSNCFG